MKFKSLVVIILFGITALSSCKKEEEQTCTNCEANSINIEVCEMENGNAEVSGVDSGVVYAEYVAALELAGSVCD